jgi:hypothetical protein
MGTRRLTNLHVDYDGDLAGVYERGRELPNAVVRLWTDAIGRHLGPRDLVALDLGAGTGRFSAALADHLGCEVIAVEPSDDMRAVTAGQHPHAGVTLRKDIEPVDLGHPPIGAFRPCVCKADDHAGPLGDEHEPRRIEETRE